MHDHSLRNPRELLRQDTLLRRTLRDSLYFAAGTRDLQNPPVFNLFAPLRSGRRSSPAPLGTHLMEVAVSSGGGIDSSVTRVAWCRYKDEVSSKFVFI
jgi:hypothetical protein